MKLFTLPSIKEGLNMDKNYDSLDSDFIEDEEILEEIDNLDQEMITEESNNENNESMQELGKASAATGTLGAAAPTYNKFTQSNLGKALMNHGKNNSYQNPNNNIKNRINNNRFNQFGKYQTGNNVNANLESTNNPLSNISNSKEPAKNILNSLIGGKEKINLEGTNSPIKGILGDKKFMLLKLKILGFAMFFLGIIFIFLFICNTLDIDQQNFLELTTWNTSGGGTTAGTVNSDTNFSNTDKEELKNSLIDKIGEEGITELTTKINNSGNNKCDGINVANKLVTLIDEIGTKGYKIPYGNYSKDNYQIINSDWGKTSEDGSIIGLNEFGVIDWALNTANINNPATSMNDYKDRTRIIDLEYANPGDLVMFDNKAYIILQNTGTNITTAYTDTSGLTYKKYTYNDLSSSTAIDMNSYYKDNCKN